MLAKHVGRLLALRPRVIAFELLYTLVLYYVVFAAIAISDLLFVLAGTGLVSLHAIGPYARIWILAFLLFVLEVGIALSREEGEDSFGNLLLVVVAYFTYCQLWIYLVARSLIDDVVLRRTAVWAKTERFAEQAQATEAPAAQSQATQAAAPQAQASPAQEVKTR